MKAATPFNPINLPDLALPAREPQVPQPIVAVARKKSTTRKPTRPAKIRRVLDIPPAAIRFTTKIRRQVRRLSKRIKGGITSRLAHLDRDKLKRVLISCGVAAAVATAIVVLVKLTPLIVTLLALLGLGAVLRLWAKLRSTRIPA